MAVGRGGTKHKPAGGTELTVHDAGTLRVRRTVRLPVYKHHEVRRCAAGTPAATGSTSSSSSTGTRATAD